jgi:hypothetical protein
MAPLIMVSLLTVSSFFSTRWCFLRGGLSPSGDPPPLSLACGLPLVRMTLPFVKWRRPGFYGSRSFGCKENGTEPATGVGWAGRPGPTGLGPPRPGSVAPFAPVGPYAFMYFAPSTCMILTMSSSRPRWRFSSHEVRSFTLQSPGVFLVALWSLPPLEVISSNS